MVRHGMKPVVCIMPVRESDMTLNLITGNGHRTHNTRHIDFYLSRTQRATRREVLGDRFMGMQGLFSCLPHCCFQCMVLSGNWHLVFIST